MRSIPPSRLVALAAAVAAILAVVSTHRVFNNMYDEPAHLAAGMEWLSEGTFTLEPQHPPLSRVAAAVLPWLDGERSHGLRDLYDEGRAILGSGAHYDRVLTLARLGQLPFFVTLLLVTWFWARRLAGERVAALAVLFAAANPNLLGHAGIAGTDNGPAALMPLALFATALWLEQPSLRRSALLGAAIALCGLTKFNAIAYWLPAAVGVAALTWWPRPGRIAPPPTLPDVGRQALLALGVAGAVTWATYRFSIGPVGGVILPAPELWQGLSAFFAHSTGGHPAFLLGEVRTGGWWYYDLVAFLVKTPVPLLIFGTVGAVLAMRGPRTPSAIAPVLGIASVLVMLSLTPVDLGIRLALAAYPLLAILAAQGAMWAWQRSSRASNRFVLAAFALWTLADPVAMHPDHVAYFNVFAGPRPERVLVDSNLDWGQDLYRLRDLSRELRMDDTLRLHYFGTASFAAIGLERARRLRPHERATGWVAASETFYAGVWADTALHWLRAYQPVARVGRSIRLYRIAADSISPAQRPGRE